MQGNCFKMRHQPDDLNQQPHLLLLNQEKMHSCDLSILYYLSPLKTMEHSHKSSELIDIVPLKHFGSVSKISMALPDIHITRFLPAKKDLWDFLWDLGTGQVGPQS